MNIENIKKKILRYLEHGELDTRELHEKIGGRIEDIIIALDELKKEGKIA